MKKALIGLLASIAFSGAALGIVIENHSHVDPLVNGHSGGLDKNGGHNCSEKSKKKGLCTGYHYHR